MVIACPLLHMYCFVRVRSFFHSAGKHVLCEKPISEDTADIISCFDTAEKCGKTLMAAFNRSVSCTVYLHAHAVEVEVICICRLPSLSLYVISSSLVSVLIQRQ